MLIDKLVDCIADLVFVKTNPQPQFLRQKRGRGEMVGGPNALKYQNPKFSVLEYE